MKIITRLLAFCLAVALIASTVVWATPSLRIETGVKLQVWGLNLGVIPVKKADWGFLKLRSGKVGLDALRYLEQHGTTDTIRQTSVAVQDQWFEAGHIRKSDSLGETVTQDEETNFNALRLRPDGMTLRQDLLPGQKIPESFWQTWRYRLACNLPAKDYATGECSLSMVDLTGDNHPEILLDAHIVGTLGVYAKPAIARRLAVYKYDGAVWRAVGNTMRLCDEYPANAGDGRVHVSTQKLDMLWLNSRAVNFFDTCFSNENMISDPIVALKQARPMAPHLMQIPLLRSSRSFPPSLVQALAAGSVILPLASEAPLSGIRQQFSGLPSCFTNINPKACMAIVADIDHDGSDDVVIVDRMVRQDAVAHRLATLLMVRNSRWTVIRSHAICANEGEKLEDLPIEFKPSAWRPIEFAGRLYLPSEPSDACTRHYLSL